MYQYIDDMISAIPESFYEGVGLVTPAPDNLFDIRDPSDTPAVTLLTKYEKELYHHIMAQCLYLSKQGRPGIQAPISFHCTLVCCPTNKDKRSWLVPSGI